MDQKKDVKFTEKKGVTKVASPIVLSSDFTINVCKCKYLEEVKNCGEKKWLTKDRLNYLMLCSEKAT